MPKNNFIGTEHFKLGTSDKIACSCGCGFVPDQDFMEKIETLRLHVGFPLQITSAARCPEYNAKVASTGKTGPHTTGRAIDIGILGERALRVLDEALAMGFTGIGVNQKGNGRFIHLDDLPNADGQPRPYVWSY